MNVRRAFPTCLFAAVAVLAMGPTFTPGAEKAEKEEGGVKSVDDAWQTAMIKGEVDAVVACYADDGVLWTPHDNAKGTSDLRQVFNRLLGDTRVSEMRTEDAVYRTVGDRSVGWGVLAITIKPKDGSADERTIRGRFTSVAEKRGGKWVYVVHHISEEK